MPDVNVVYDFESRTVTVDVVVVDEEIFAALPVLLRGPWTVIWTVNGSAFIFDLHDGIKIHDAELPVNLTYNREESQRVPDHKNCWSIPFQNDCQTTNSVNYGINLQLPESDDSGDVKIRKPELRLHHDPTLSVVSDPPTG
ncbi:MAG: hypothetical protein QOH06_3440 [Acidobacteriota bacterium]|nr:hypothetical protein [Acidobacteriota bacterium]